MSDPAVILFALLFRGPLSLVEYNGLLFSAEPQKITMGSLDMTARE